MCGTDIFLGLLAILFPPIAVWVKRGLCSVDSLINIALCCLGFLPGLLHAWYIIAITPDPTYESLDPEQGRGQPGVVTYYYVQQGQPHYSSSAAHTQPNYGTVAPGPASTAAGPQPAGREEVPPTYDQAVRGDNKVQGP
ncbi:putative stress response RCI peptide [Teratosphaeria destructans]|uniref:Stress response RCI peptide n=1 Tax=Teratosphaeria destructans TaxID=418781 RepID=A0A9W7T0B1_9PEZI|nr:putative stress response RCI peptide [Teratosphaeria destructans]